MKQPIHISHRYDDIIHLPHHTSPLRPRMPIRERAAQFAPFAALVGYKAAIQETARLTDSRAELTEEEKSLLDGQLRMALGQGGEPPLVHIRYFVPDKRKAGGAYATAAGRIQGLDGLARALVLDSGASIPIEDIVQVDFEPGPDCFLQGPP